MVVRQRSVKWVQGRMNICSWKTIAIKWRKLKRGGRLCQWNNRRYFKSNKVIVSLRPFPWGQNMYESGFVYVSLCIYSHIIQGLSPYRNSNLFHGSIASKRSLQSKSIRITIFNTLIYLIGLGTHFSYSPTCVMAIGYTDYVIYFIFMSPSACNEEHNENKFYSKSDDKLI